MRYEAARLTGAAGLPVYRRVRSAGPTTAADQPIATGQSAASAGTPTRRRRRHERFDVMRWLYVLLFLVALGACASHDDGRNDNRQGGFYGGVSGGLTR